MQQRRLRTVLGMYPTRAGVEIAVEAFRDAGFRIADISLVLPETMTYETFCVERATALAGALSCDVELSAPQELLPAPDALDTASELAAALIDLGVPKYETEGYAGKVLGGNALLSVHCDSPEKTLAARRLHGDLGGMDVFIAHCAEQEFNKGRSMACSAGR